MENPRQKRSHTILRLRAGLSRAIPFRAERDRRERTLQEQPPTVDASLQLFAKGDARHLPRIPLIDDAT